MKEDMAIFLQWAQTAHPLLVRFIIRHVMSQEQASVLAELARVELARMDAVSFAACGQVTSYIIAGICQARLPALSRRSRLCWSVAYAIG